MILLGIFYLLYGLTILIGTVYLVGWCGWSMWTFLLAIIFMYGRIEYKFNTKK